jgi:hypothetical protein
MTVPLRLSSAYRSSLVAVGVAAFVLAAAGCEEGEERLSAEALARCGSRGSPVTIAQLVRTGRANGTTLSIKESQCRKVEPLRVSCRLFGLSLGLLA